MVWEEHLRSNRLVCEEEGLPVSYYTEDLASFLKNHTGLSPCNLRVLLELTGGCDKMNFSQVQPT